MIGKEDLHFDWTDDEEEGKEGEGLRDIEIHFSSVALSATCRGAFVIPSHPSTEWRVFGLEKALDQDKIDELQRKFGIPNFYHFID